MGLYGRNMDIGETSIIERVRRTSPTTGTVEDDGRTISASSDTFNAIIRAFNILKRREKILFRSGKYTLAEAYAEMDNKYQDLVLNITNTLGSGPGSGTLSSNLIQDKLDHWPTQFIPGNNGGDLFVSFNIEANVGGFGRITFTTPDTFRVTDFILEEPKLDVAGTAIRIAHANVSANDGLYTLKVSPAANIIEILTLFDTNTAVDTTAILTIVNAVA